MVSADVMPFWRAVLGYDAKGDEYLVDPRGRGQAIWFQNSDERRTQRNRTFRTPFEGRPEHIKVAAAVVRIGLTSAEVANRIAHLGVTEGAPVRDPDGHQVKFVRKL